MELTEATEIINKLKDKELSFGCIINLSYAKSLFVYEDEGDDIITLEGWERFEHKKYYIEKIIWHPFTYWYAIDWIEKNAEFKDYDEFETLWWKVLVEKNEYITNGTYTKR